MTFRSEKLLRSAAGAACVRCGRCDGTVVSAHYFGPRRGSYGGGMSIKVHDFLIAHLCAQCHTQMDTTSRNKTDKWVHSEEFLHFIALTLARLFHDGVVVVKGE
jgi:hypothetical protein